MSNWRPLHERVIVKEVATPDKTAGGLFIPAEAKEIPTEGIVHSFGGLVNKEGEDLRVGDRVLYMKYAGLPIKLNGEEHRILMCNDIIAVRDDSESRKSDSNLKVVE